MSAVTARRPVRIWVTRFAGTAIRRASSAALMPSSSSSSLRISPGWMGVRAMPCLNDNRRSRLLPVHPFRRAW